MIKSIKKAFRRKGHSRNRSLLIGVPVVQLTDGEGVRVGSAATDQVPFRMVACKGYIFLFQNGDLMNDLIRHFHHEINGEIFQNDHLFTW
jgi:hypothetical protein